MRISPPKNSPKLKTSSLPCGILVLFVCGWPMSEASLPVSASFHSPRKGGSPHSATIVASTHKLSVGCVLYHDIHRERSCLHAIRTTNPLLYIETPRQPLATFGHKKHKKPTHNKHRQQRQLHKPQLRRIGKHLYPVLCSSTPRTTTTNANKKTSAKATRAHRRRPIFVCHLLLQPFY